MIGPLARGAEDAAAEPAPPGLPTDDGDEAAPGAREPRRVPGVPRGRFLLAVVALVIVAAFLIGGRSLVDFEAFHAWTKRLPAAGVAGLIAVLPLVGFPISALHLAAGLRFGFFEALALVAVATLGHHVTGWGLVHVLPDRFFSRLDPWRKKLAGAGYRQAAVLCCLLPGMPYTVQLYLLPVMGAPLRVLCLVSVPLHTTRATVTILLGNISDDLSPGRVTALVAYYLVVFTICGFTLRRLRRSLAGGDGDAPRTRETPDETGR